MGNARSQLQNVCRMMGYGVLASSRRIPLFNVSYHAAAIFARVAAPQRPSSRLRSMLGPVKIGLFLLWSPLTTLVHARRAPADPTRRRSAATTPSLRVHYDLFYSKGKRGRMTGKRSLHLNIHGRAHVLVRHNQQLQMGHPMKLIYLKALPVLPCC